MIRNVLLAALALATFVTPAAARTVWSPPMGAGTICSVVNVSDRARDVSIEVYGSTGVHLGALTTTRTLQPGRVMHNSTSNSAAYCKITFAGGQKSLRMSATACGPSGCFGRIELK